MLKSPLRAAGVMAARWIIHFLQVWTQNQKMDILTGTVWCGLLLFRTVSEIFVGADRS